VYVPFSYILLYECLGEKDLEFYTKFTFYSVFSPKCMVLNTTNLGLLSHEEISKFVSDHLYCSNEIIKANNHAKHSMRSDRHFKCK